MELIRKGDKFFKKHIGGGRPKEITEAELMMDLLKNGCEPNILREEVARIFENARCVSEDTGLDISTQKMEVAKQFNPFQNFIRIDNYTNNSQVIYYQKETETELVCSAAVFDSRVLKPILEKYDPELLENLHKNMAKLISPKDWTQVSILQSLDVCFNLSLMTETIRKGNVSQDPHPAIVQGIDKFSLVIIPYMNLECSFEHLNKPLQDFLERTSHHEHLCAILWSHFIGNLLPYVIYLRGDGGDGKTSFINMLGKLARSYANFDGGDRFNYFNMFGKSIIGLNENESSKLMQNRVVKSISGGNLVQVEGKGKNSFSGQIRGLIMIDSNYDLELLGREDEKRRLRYFRVQPITKDKDFVTIAQDEFVTQLGSTPNEFLNYCRKCYEKLSIQGSGGLIQETPNHLEVFSELTDTVQEHKFAEFYKNYISKQYHLEHEGKCESVYIILELQKKFPKEPYVVRNFKKYLESKYDVKPNGKYFIGLVKTNDRDKQIEEAMPK